MPPTACSNSSSNRTAPAAAAEPVAYIVSTWPRLSQTFVLNEVLALENKGLDIRIFSVKHPGGEPVHDSVSQVRAPLTYLALKGRRRRIWTANLAIACRRPGTWLRILLEAARYRSTGVLKHFLQAGYLAESLRRAPVHHIHAHFATAPALVAMYASALSGIRYTFTAHARDIYVDTRPELLRRQIERAAAVVTISEYNRRYLSGMSSAAGAKVRCIYNGVDPTLFPFRRAGFCTTGLPVILSVARLVEKKGLADLVDSAAILRTRGLSFRVEIIGAGPLLGPLRTRIASLGLDRVIDLSGAQSQDAIRAAYQRSTVFALPCVITPDGDRDGIPTVLLEAMLSGVPVVTTPVSGISELIGADWSGLLVPPGNPGLLANALERLLTDAELRDHLARTARAKVESQFSIDRSSAQLMTLFSGGAGQ
jgi:colanic acid/amylovoran biosynthesis glycosyltransferase